MNMSYFFFNFLMKLLFSHPIKPFNLMNPSILKYLYYIRPLCITRNTNASVSGLPI